MTNITKAAQDDQALAALDRLVETHSRNYHPFANPIASDAQLALRHIRAALQDKAGEVRDAGWFRLIRDGSGWPAVFASHDAPEPLRGDDLDAAMIAVPKQHATASTVATDVTVAIDHLYNERRDGMTDRIWPPVKIGTKLRSA